MLRFIVFFIALLISSLCCPSFAVDGCETLLSNQYQITLTDINDSKSVIKKHLLNVIKSMTSFGHPGIGEYVQFYTIANEMDPHTFFKDITFPGIITLYCNDKTNVKELFFYLPNTFSINGSIDFSYWKCKGKLAEKQISGRCKTTITRPSFFTLNGVPVASGTETEKANFSGEAITE